ncbi:chemotaxis protein CheW [Rhodoferax sp. BAB1]|jgi:twitching motility protein PilI|uniref:chemotaxis protein CheW n=1 Tax=Rhodoferax sp. BAB1 TaxID=2741720 RepID=UPI0015767B1D|nr:chemotaxis protein CheW [Rhodoferax sp. BAB1]QKO20475.1 chemotaxis protein CheW [Rhodoferax sp. BAB1]
MANREALRDLQSRLASRLQAAKAEGLSISWLAVRAGGLDYLLPLAQSGEIFPLPAVQAVPYSQPWFLGVVNLRGGLYGVVDLASYIAGKAPVRTEQYWAEASVVTLNAALEINCSLLIDSLAGLRHVGAFSGSEPPPEGAPPYFGNRYVDADGSRWQEINLQQLSQMSEFLSISA